MLTIQRDTREQRGLDFAVCKGKVGVVIDKKLDFGDYGCLVDGKLFPVVFERKSKADLWGTMTKGYKRYKAEFNRAIEAQFIFILAIECKALELRHGFSYKVRGKRIPSKFTPKAMIKKLQTLKRKYGLKIWFCNGRADMARRIVEYYERALKGE